MNESQNTQEESTVKNSPINISIPLMNPADQELSIPLQKGVPLFVLGANGTGQSALMAHLNATSQYNSCKWIQSQRRSDFSDDVFDITPMQLDTAKHDSSQALRRRFYARYSNSYRNAIPLNALVRKEISRSIEITRHMDNKNEQEARKCLSVPDPASVVNALLASVNMPFRIFIKDGQIHAKNRNLDAKYHIAELSDGERNTLLIACDVVTAETGSVILIDEPERHLHRSIISPFLTALFKERDDCYFVISTHEVYLPIDNPDSSTLLIRNCERNDLEISRWDADLLTAQQNIPDDIKKQILGPKRKVLFVEGDDNSLDKRLYELLYEGVAVIPGGSYSEVEQKVKAMRKLSNEHSLHWISAYGIIDGDGKTDTEKNQLRSQGIVALSCYSVESLYYNEEVIRKAAEKYAHDVTEKDFDDICQDVYKDTEQELQNAEETLCAAKVAHKIRSEVLASLPTSEDIANDSNLKKQYDWSHYLAEEKQKFDNWIKNKNWNALIQRYPIKKSGVLEAIACHFRSGKQKAMPSYQDFIIKMVRNNENNLREYYKTELLKEVTDLIES